MKAIRIHAYGGPDVMLLEELPMPIPGAGQALVRVHAASVNFLDIQKRRGRVRLAAVYPPARRGGARVPPRVVGERGGRVEATRAVVRKDRNVRAARSHG